MLEALVETSDGDDHFLFVDSVCGGWGAPLANAFMLDGEDFSPSFGGSSEMDGDGLSGMWPSPSDPPPLPPGSIDLFGEHITTPLVTNHHIPLKGGARA